MRLRSSRRPAICSRRTLTTATSAGVATSSLGPPPPPASQRARRTRAPLVGIACAGAIPLQQPSNRTISPRSGGGTVARKGGPHNIASPALRKVNRDRPHYQCKIQKPARNMKKKLYNKNCFIRTLRAPYRIELLYFALVISYLWVPMM